jgi:hypothetical protein
MTTATDRWRRFRCARRSTVRATEINAGRRALNLLQFASPALPIGAYSYSQGLEAALENGALRCRHRARLDRAPPA